MSNKPSRDGNDWKAGLAAVGLALSIPFLIGVPAYLGWQLDQKYGTWPLWFVILLLVGVAATALDVYRLMKAFRMMG